jgi:hypothetical protein
VKFSVKLPRVLFSDDTVNVLPLPVTSRLLGPLVNVTEPLGLTVKATVPLPCFENESGFGVVVTVTIHGVGDGEGFAPGDGDGLAPGDGDGLAPGDAEGLAPGDAEGLALGDADGLAPGDGDGLAPGDGDGVGVGEEFGLLLPLTVEPESMPVRPLTFTFTFGTSSR